MILGGPKDTITSLWTKGLKALVPPNSFGPPPMGGVGVDFKDRRPPPLPADVIYVNYESIKNRNVLFIKC